MNGNCFAGHSPPGLFVSWKNHPKVSIAPLSPASTEIDAALLDSPEQWYGLPQERIVSFRQLLIQSRKAVNVREAANPSRGLAVMQELAMSAKPVQAEFELNKKPRASLSFDAVSAPLGPIAQLNKMSLAENPSIPRRVDYAVSDTDLKSQLAIMNLYNAGLSVHFISRLLSSGALGIKKNRKLTPTRWSITAVDSRVSEALIEGKIKHLQQLGQHELFHSNYLYNDFWVLLVPGVWSFEQLECWLPGTVWSPNAKTASIIQDHEFYGGRKGYASNVEGAYYSARLAVAEHLLKVKRQATAIVFREIGSGYACPLGVWQIRENVRHALKQKPVSFSSLGLALHYLGSKLTVPMKFWLAKSKVFDKLRHQRTLLDFQPTT
jgi:hypothetical protein